MNGAMKPWGLTALLLLATGLALVTVPPLRRVVAGAVRATAFTSEFVRVRRDLGPGSATPPPGQLPTLECRPGEAWWLSLAAFSAPPISAAECEAVAQTHPGEADAWWGCAELGRARGDFLPPGPAGTSIASAYERAISLSADTTAVRLRYALYLFAVSGGLPPRAPQPLRPPLYPTPEQTARLQQAQALLGGLQRDDPGNAAVDYLLACTCLARGQEAGAVAAARSCLAKSCWNLHVSEAVAASWRVADALGPVDKSLVRSVGRVRPVWPDLQRGAQQLVALAGRSRERGDHATALVCYESLLRLGEPLRTGAYSAMEGAVAGQLADAVSASFAEATVPADAGAPSGRQALDAARERALAYFRQQGRDDLASLYRYELAARPTFDERCRRALQRETRGLLGAVLGGYTGSAIAVWALAFVFLLLVAGFALDELVGRSLHRHMTTVPWSYRDWGLLLLAALAPSLPLALDLTGSSHRGFAPFACASLAVALVGMVLWSLLALHLPARRHGYSAREAWCSFVLVPAVRDLLLPTCAALILLSALALWPLAGASARTTAVLRAASARGELSYYLVRGNALPSPGPRAERPAACQPCLAGTHEPSPGRRQLTNGSVNHAAEGADRLRGCCSGAHDPGRRGLSRAEYVRALGDA